MDINPVGGSGGDGFELYKSLNALRQALQKETEIHKQIDLLSTHATMLIAFLILTPKQQQDVLRGIDQQITTASANMGGDSEEGRRQKQRYEHFSRLKERLLRIQSNAETKG